MQRRSAARRGWWGRGGGVHWANQAGAWRRGGGGAPSLLPPLPPGPALTGGPGRLAGKCRRRRRPPPAAWGGSPGGTAGRGAAAAPPPGRRVCVGRVVSAGWSQEAAPRPASRACQCLCRSRRGAAGVASVMAKAREPASGGEDVLPPRRPPLRRRRRRAREEVAGGRRGRAVAGRAVGRPGRGRCPHVRPSRARACHGCGLLPPGRPPDPGVETRAPPPPLPPRLLRRVEVRAARWPGHSPYPDPRLPFPPSLAASVCLPDS